MEENLLEVTNPESEIENSEVPVLADFFATWCGPCKMIAPIIESIGKKYENEIKVIKIDVDKHKDLAEKYEIMSIPSILFFSGGKLVRKEVGFKSEREICDIINSELILKK